MTCPSCSQEIRESLTVCPHCGAALGGEPAGAVDAPETKEKSGGTLRLAGGLLLVVGALMFASAAVYGGGGTAGLAIVFFVAGLVVFFAGRVHVAER